MEICLRSKSAFAAVALALVCSCAPSMPNVELEKAKADLRASQAEVERLRRETEAAAAEPKTGGTAATAPHSEDAPGLSHVIQVGDVLEVLVWKNEELSRAVKVQPGGRITLPLLNEVDVAGLTTAQLRARLIERLAEYIPAAEVSVLVKEARGFMVSVMGEVRSPGQYEIQGLRATVLEALARAGGLSEFASPSGIVVLRTDKAGKSQRIEFDYKGALRGEEGTNLTLESGDIVNVP